MAKQIDFVVNNGLVVSTTATIKSNLNATSTSTAALTVAGGLGVGRNLWTGGLGRLVGGLYIDSQAFNTATGYLNSIFTEGGAYITKGLSVNGPLLLEGTFVGTTATIIQISGNSAEFFGDSSGFGALYAGIPYGFSQLPSTVFQVTSDVNSYAQNNFQNLNNGDSASTDWVATAGNGDNSNYYIDLGINSQTYNPSNGVGDANDGYLYVQGSATGGPGGDLWIGATSPTQVVRIISGGSTASSVVAIFNAPNTNSTSSISGALTVAGGVGVTQDLYVGGTIYGNIDGIISTATTILVSDVSSSTSYYIALADAKNSDANLLADSILTYDTTNGTLTVPITSATSVSVLSNVEIGGTLIVTGDQGLVTILGYNGVSFLADNVTGFLGGEIVVPQTSGLGLTSGVNYYVIGVLSPTKFILSTSTNGSGVGTIGVQTIIALTTKLTPGLTVTTEIESTSTTNGAAVITGGVGIGGNLNVGGRIIGGGVRTTSAGLPPTNPSPTIGDIWYNTMNDAIYRYTDDGTGNLYWIDITGPVVYNQHTG
jgi:hypothetical protein